MKGRFPDFWYYDALTAAMYSAMRYKDTDKSTNISKKMEVFTESG